MSTSQATPPQIRIRARESEDWEALATLCAALPPAENPLGVQYPGRTQAMHAFAAPEPPHSFGFVAIRDGTLVGEITLEQGSGRIVHLGTISRLLIDPRAGRTAMGAIGDALLSAALDVADNSLNLVRVQAQCLVEQPTLVAIYRGHGFGIEGTMRDALFRAGRYLDVYQLGRVRDAR